MCTLNDRTIATERGRHLQTRNSGSSTLVAALGRLQECFFIPAIVLFQLLGEVLQLHGMDRGVRMRCMGDISMSQSRERRKGRTFVKADRLSITHKR